MDRIMLFCLLLFVCVGTYSSETNVITNANIQGKVTCDGENIPFATVLIKGTTLGTSTDSDGVFKFNNLPVGKHTVIARGVGYRSTEHQLIVKANETQNIFFTLEEDILHLESVVVTADRNQLNRSEASVIINSLTPKLFEKAQAICVADGLDFTPGLRMECNCQNCGFSQVRMNGLEGPYSQILINSRPVFSGLAGVYGLELIPTSMVDRIEVVRGGGSALFGGNAIAGTINIITKEPHQNSFEIKSNLGIIGIGTEENTKPSFDRTLNLNASVISNDQKSGLFIYGMARQRDPYDENGDGFSEIVVLDNTTLGLSTFFKPNDKSKLMFDYYRINEFRRGGNKFDYLPHESDITEQVDHLINGASLAYDLFTHANQYHKLSLFVSGQTVDRQSYYGAQHDLSAYGATNDISISGGAHYTLHLKRLLFAPSVLIFGCDNNFNQLNDVKLGALGATNSTLTNQFVNTIGNFAQNDWTLGATKISFGLRYDHYLVRNLDDNQNEKADDLIGNVLAPRANILYQVSPSIQLRASYAKGYRAPQLFDEDLHIEASGAKRVLHSNAPDLKQETSHSITSSVNSNVKIGEINSEFLLEGFYTRLVNPFSNEYKQLDNAGTFEYVRINAEDGAHVAGTNMELNTAFGKNLMLQIGYTLQKARYEKAQAWGENETSTSYRFVRTPNQYGFATLEYHAIKNLEFSMTGTYTGSMLIPHFGLDLNTSITEELEAIKNGDVITGERLEISEQFLHIGGKVAYTIELGKHANIELNLGIQNLFNQNQKKHDSGLFRDAGYIYGPCKPRTIIFGVTFRNR